MDSNRDEADRCIEIAITHIEQKKFDKARKFLEKAERLYSSQKAKGSKLSIIKYIRIMTIFLFLLSYLLKYIN